jgi:3-deoxy-7-phosphoheptulonate synthase
MEKNCTEKEFEKVNNKIINLGFFTTQIFKTKKIVVHLINDENQNILSELKHMPGIKEIISVSTPYKLVNRKVQKERTVIKVKGINIGDESTAVISGPCAVESKEQLLKAAGFVKKAGAHILRGGAFKPRTSPYSFQGLGEKGLKLLREVSLETGLPTITEVIDEKSFEMALNYVDILQVGARNMQNFHLLKNIGKADKPVLLKRGMSATVEEWLMAAEYIMSEGNENIILCERGIRTFENQTRNTLDLSIVPLVKKLSHLPVIVDPSHATGKRDLVSPMSLAAVAAGADGLIIEMHPEPEKALSDGAQSLHPHELEKLMKQLKKLANSLDRKMEFTQFDELAI